MKITKISYSLEQTIQVKEFHPRKFSVSLEAELADGESADVEAQTLKEKATQIIKTDVDELLESIRAKKKSQLTPPTSQN